MKKVLAFIFLSCACVTLLTAQALDEGVRIAINRLGERVNRPIDIIIGNMVLEGTTDTTSGLSLYLNNVVKLYADNHNLFRVVVINRGPKTDEPETEKGIISGTFAQRGNTVEVFLNLSLDTSGRSLGSERIVFSVEELTRLDIAIEPENKKEREQLERIFDDLAGSANTVEPSPRIVDFNARETNQTTQGINIQASFNSDSRTYMHRSELKMTVMADQNCYFKIIHIDVDNQMKMIYPNSRDTDNYLRANTPRNVFENASYMLYAPYGEETILIVTSTEQFKNMEQEYLAPWTAVTAESLREAVGSSRGGDLELSTGPVTFSGEGQARYSITILKPHEEYEYKKPENMTETYQTIRNDVQRQGGFFEGNETSGYYIVNNVRGSYRVPRDSDVIQFTTYYLDSYTGGPNAGVRTRGAGFNFSFARPGDIIQAVQEVKSGIEGKGGSFSGNEEEGNFRASGISGQYKISDVVNVTITEKPFIVPNSLIEKEVKNYFGR